MAEVGWIEIIRFIGQIVPDIYDLGEDNFLILRKLIFIIQVQG